jgi:hypothetical protein
MIFSLEQASYSQCGDEGGEILGSLSGLSTCSLSGLLWKNSGAVVAKKMSF